jgi:hypothetical protein
MLVTLRVISFFWRSAARVTFLVQLGILITVFFDDG